MSETLVVDTTRPEDKNYNNDLTEALGELGCEPTVISYIEAAQMTDRINAARRVIISGVPFHYPAESAEDLQPYLATWLPKIEVPVLGICLGHQALGLTFGATMRRDEEVETGTCMAEVLDEHLDDLVFKGLKKHFEVASFHWASIAIKEEPHQDNGLIRLARSLPKSGVSTGCENLIVKVGKKPTYGVQFHPEKSATGKVFLRNFLDLSINEISYSSSNRNVLH